MLGSRSAKGMALEIARLVADGELAAGTQLPPVRTLAHQLGISPTTVSAAWQTLRRHGVIQTRGRRGTTVQQLPQPMAPTRFARLHQGRDTDTLDLSAGTPDPALLPDLRHALRSVERHTGVDSYFGHSIQPDLESVLREDWPFPPEAMTMVDGAVDAMDRIFATILRLGDWVLVENPTFPPILDLLEQRGVEVVGLNVDDDGIRADSLEAALRVSPPPTAIVLQPRAHNPHAHAMDQYRAAELARLLQQTPKTLVVEDDHAGSLSLAPPVSIGKHLPERTMHVRGFSKSHGPDLRLAAIGGAGAVTEQIVRRRLLGPGWSSQVLQTILLYLLTDQITINDVAYARATYAHRRQQLTQALNNRGIPVTGTEGFNMWISVPDEKTTLINLAIDQITAAPGTPFLTAPLGGDHIRLTCATITSEYHRLADRIAQAGTPHTNQYRR